VGPSIQKSSKASEMKSLFFPQPLALPEMCEGQPPGPETHFGAIAPIEKAAKNLGQGKGLGMNGFQITRR